VLEQTSNNGINWISEKTMEVEPNKPIEIFNAVIGSSYRVRMQNYQSAQTRLVVQALLHTNRTTRAKIYGASNNGDVEVQVDEAGSLQVTDITLSNMLKDFLQYNTNFITVCNPLNVPVSVTFLINDTPILNSAGLPVTNTFTVIIPANRYTKKQLAYILNTAMRGGQYFTYNEITYNQALVNPLSLTIQPNKTNVNTPRARVIGSTNYQFIYNEQYDCYAFIGDDSQISITWPDVLKQLYINPDSRTALA